MVEQRKAKRTRWVGWAILTPVMLTSAQPLVRKATTVSALVAYPVFFHGQRVVVRADIVEREQLSWVGAPDSRLLCLGCTSASPAEPTAPEHHEISGVFWDVGRLEASDARLASHEVSRISDRLLGKPWPASGELLAIVADEVDPATRPAAPTVRAVALEPERYLDRQITVTGRFRGRNLYGDLPEAPRQSRWDFVLQSADAALWVTGLRPSGRDFSLDPSARVDTNRWLEVTGTVSQARGLVWLDATRIALAKPPAEEPIRLASPPSSPAVPPEVVFSAPTSDEVDVPRDATVRIQFSRDMDARSFRDSVRLTYVGTPEESPSPSHSVTLSTSYNEGNRVLEIRFSQPLEPFRTVKIELLDRIAAHDGVPMGKPWSLTFTLGGS